MNLSHTGCELVATAPAGLKPGLIPRTTAHLLFIFVLLLQSSAVLAEGRLPNTPQWTHNTDQGTEVSLWFFWSSKCPHCRDAHPHIDSLEQELPWLRLKSYQLDGYPENIALYRWLASSLSEEARSVPAFIFCGQMLTGWGESSNARAYIVDNLKKCRQQGVTAAEKTQQLNLPILGDIDPEDWSLTMFTIAIAGLDSFNPCAFFVLMFLLSLLVHAGSRSRMLIVGGFFIFISGLVYFLSMAAWLNLFGFIGHITMVTFIAGLIAVSIAAVNIKDYFMFKQGVSLSISDHHRGRLMQRMRGLLSADSLPTMLAATFTLAVIANLYELLCTAGFPMVYTRYLTLNELSPSAYYLYLLLYNLVYILPLTIIMALFVVRFGQRKLQQHEGRILKLLSGLMMLALGTVLMVDPALLNHIGFAVGLLLGVVLVTWAIVKLIPVRRS